MRKILWRCIANNMADLMMNEEIRDREVRVIDQNGEQLGVQPIRKALELAEEAGLDLVKIVPTAKPPVCKLMDYDKYRYEQAKKEREIRRNQKVVSIKEVQLSATIEENDIRPRRKRPSSSFRVETRSRFRFASAAGRSPIRRSVWRLCRISSRGLRTWPLWSASPSSRVAT